MNMNLRLAAFLAALAMSACASGGSKPSSSGGPRPAWVEGESPRFPRSRFILGVGSGDDEATAAERARGELAKVFSANITADTTVEETEGTLNAGGKTATSFSQSVAQKVRTATDKVLEGVDVVERWKDATGRYYALAALPKDQALLAVTEKLHSLDEEAASYKTTLDAASGRFEKAKAAAKLSALLKARGELEAEHRVLGGGAATSTLDAGAAKASAAAALAALNVVVSAEGEGVKELTTGVVSGLAAAGLTAKSSTSGEAADLLVEAVVADSPAGGGDPRWKWSRATATVTLKEGKEGKSFSRFEVADRQAAADAGIARQRVLASLAKKTAEKVEASIRTFFENE